MWEVQIDTEIGNHSNHIWWPTRTTRRYVLFRTYQECEDFVRSRIGIAGTWREGYFGHRRRAVGGKVVYTNAHISKPIR